MAKTAWQQAMAWGIVPQWTRPTDPSKRQEAYEEYRKAVESMRGEYARRTMEMRHPPEPGPRPPQFSGAPPVPPAYPMPAEPPRPRSPIGLSMYPSDDQIANYLKCGTELVAEVERWKREMKEYEAALVEYKPKFLAARTEEERILREYTVRNEEWLDTVFWPGEAERNIWEAANEVYQESLRQIRAEADLARDELDIRRLKNEQMREAVSGWSPIFVKVGIALASFVACGYVVWRIFA